MIVAKVTSVAVMRPATSAMAPLMAGKSFSTARMIVLTEGLASGIGAARVRARKDEKTVKNFMLTRTD